MTEQVKLNNRPNHSIQNRMIAIVIAAIGIATVTGIGIAVGKPLIKMLEDPAAFQAWVDQKGAFGQLAFIGIMALQVIIAWLPGEPLELGAGYAFGFWEGSLLCMIGIVAGSVFVFFMVRIFGKQIVTMFFPIEKIEAIPLLRDTKRLTLLSIIIFMIPGTPKDILTYCVGLTPMKLSTWLLVAGIARIPPVITSTLSGSALGEQQYGFAIIVSVVTMVLSAAGILLYRRMSKQVNKEISQA